MIIVHRLPPQPASTRKMKLIINNICRLRGFHSAARTIQCSPSRRIIDLRSDTVTQPTAAMLRAATQANTGDDVMGEDPTVNALEAYAADLFGKENALFVPTGTMGNLCAILAHCQYNKSAEIIIGKKSHINLYEGGGYANIAGVSCKQVDEDENAMFSMQNLRDAIHLDDDVHYAKTTLICLENTHNMLGGVCLPPSYIDKIEKFAHDEWKDNGIKIHIDGARLFNAAVSLDVSPSILCAGADSVSICLSKGLGSPIGSILVGNTEFIRLARRARKRLGGGMRQAGVVASMGMYSLLHHVERLAEDHDRAQKLAMALQNEGFWIPRDGKVDTNIVFFALPEMCKLKKEELPPLLYEQYGVKISGGYSSGGEFFRLVTHMDVDNNDIETAIKGITSLCK
jgi:threonine aldolase